MTKHKTTNQPERPVWEKNVIDRVMNQYKELMLQRATVQGWQSTDFDTFDGYTGTRHHFVYFPYKKKIVSGIVTGFCIGDFTDPSLFKYVVTSVNADRPQSYQVRPEDICDTYEEVDAKMRSKR